MEKREAGIRAAAERVKVMDGYYGLDEAQTDALVEEIEKLVTA